MSEYNSQTSYNPILGDGRKREYFNEEVNPHGLDVPRDCMEFSEQTQRVIEQARIEINAERMI